MKSPVFIIKALNMSRIWIAWLLLLITINLVGGIAFIDSSAGKSATVSLIGACIVMAVIYARHGFVRLIGIGRILFWLPMEIEFTLDLMEQHPQGLFYVWLISVIVLNGLAIIFDFINVMRYLLVDCHAKSKNVDDPSQKRKA